MLKYIFILLLLINVNRATAQKNKAIPDTLVMWKTYMNAMSFGDLQVAKTALFELITAAPSNRVVYDSLAHLYFRIGAYSQAIQSADSTRINKRLKEVKAYSYRNLGDIKLALPLFESLYTDLNTPEYGYQAAMLQYTIKRYGECEETINKILQHTDVKTSKVVISTEKGDNMEVSYFAAAENLLGVLYKETGKSEKARECFLKAIAEEPGFTLARNNLSSLSDEQPQK